MGGYKMQISKRELQSGREDSRNKPKCFFCNTVIHDGEEIITRKTTYYHRECFELLFTLKIDQTLMQK